MSRKPQLNSNQEDESEDSLVAQLYRRQNQRKLADYLDDAIRPNPEMKNINDRVKINNKSHAGFSSANEFFKSATKNQQQKGHKLIGKIQEQPNDSDRSTVTVPERKNNFKDSKLNKEIQKPILEDIEDLGEKCASCQPKSPGGLNYKDRNKKLIQQHEKKVYNSQKGSEQNNFHTPEKNEASNRPRENLDLDQFKYENNEGDGLKNLPDNLMTEAHKQAMKNSFDPNKKFNFIIDKSRVAKQQKLTISNLTVFFPYQPYDAQVKYMQKVIQSLDNRQNAILQSPTGTGKTLCLLSAALSWVQNQFWKSYKQVPIVYLSRTHSQLAQVQKELKKTCFRPTMTTFGSREIFCIKQGFAELKGREKVEACNKGVKLFLKYGKQQKRHIGLKIQQTQEQQQERKSRSYLRTSQKKFTDFAPDQQSKIQQSMCRYFAGERAVLELARKYFKNKIISTEDIKKFGKQYGFCPYYYSTFVKPICNLFLMPYNYLLDSQLNAKYAPLIKDSILIFDEAHNVSESSCDGRTFSINKRTFQDAKKQLNKLIKGEKMSQQLYVVNQEFYHELPTIQHELQRIFSRINQFVSQIEFPQDEKISQEDNSQKKLFHMHETEQKIYQLLNEKIYDHQRKIFMNLPNDKAQRDIIKKMTKQMELNYVKITELCEALSQTPDGIFQNIQKVAGFVKKCIGLILQQPDKYKWVERQINHSRLMVKKIDKNWQIEMVCLVPFLTMQKIAQMEPRNIILTSGTLSPIQTWQNELGIPFPIRFNNSHVISSDQLMLRILTGEDNSLFNFSFKHLQQNFRTIYQFTLQSIIKLCENIPNGVLVVTPSYKVLNQLQRAIQFSADLRKRLNNVKKVFMESKDNFQVLIQKYRNAAVEKKGALLFCVCRGKISEGIDFPNELCRAVIFVGIPFPNVKDIVISEKRNHYDRIGQQEPSYKFSGGKWYENLTFRSVNQAIGRVIRHINDYGSIFLMDLRYNMPSYRSQLPKWAQPSLKTIQIKPELFDQLQEFYQNMKMKFGEKGKEKIDKNQTQSFETEDDDNREKPKQLNDLKHQKHSQKIKLDIKKPNKQQEIDKKVPTNAFTAIMGTNQNKFMKKKSSNIDKKNFD